MREHFRRERVVGVAKQYVAGVLEGGDWFDELLIDGGGAGVWNLASLAWQLRKRAVDLAVLLGDDEADPEVLTTRPIE